MNFLRNVLETIIEAIFPLSKAEKELFLLTPEKAFATLPRSPQVPIPDSSAIFAYKDERVRKMVWNIKYKRSEKAVSIAAYALYRSIKVLDGALLIPMPITSWRRRERGYNQCEFLLEKAMKIISEDGISSRITLERDLLMRTLHKSRQTLKSREERLESARGIFSIDETKGRELRPLQDELHSKGKELMIIVIDDVITTGSTMKEAMATLNKAGFTNVRGLSIAH